MPDTEFFLPRSSSSQEIEKILSKKFRSENRYLSIVYNDFIPEEGMIKCSYEYHLDNNDVNYLLQLIAYKYQVNNINSLFIIHRLFNGDNPEFDFYDQFEVLYNCWDYLPNYEPDIIDKVKEYCLDKAKNEFLIAFNYWVSDNEKDDYYEYEDI